MTQVIEILNKIQSKRKAIETITNWLANNPLSCIKDEMIESRSIKIKELADLRLQLEKLS